MTTATFDHCKEEGSAVNDCIHEGTAVNDCIQEGSATISNKSSVFYNKIQV
jgi:hypothetical protein